jgi:hypothetical protein
MQEEEEKKNNYIKMANIIVLGTMHLQAPVISNVLQAGICCDMLHKRIAYCWMADISLF